MPNWSLLSNVVQVTTLAEDTLPPDAVTDLKVAAAQINVAYLSWTAPTDEGMAGVAGYDVRYSTSQIDESNWDQAMQATGEPAAAAPGATERFAVTGLNPSTTYYFAVKSSDYAEPVNVSAISNIATCTTMPPVQPVTVHNPWLVNDRVADTRNIQTMGATYVNAYTPDGVIPPANDEQKAINIYNNQKRRLYHWADDPPSVGNNNISDPAYNQNVFGWGLCGRHSANACTIVNAAGLIPHQMNISNPYGHWMYQVEYDGALHAFDTMTTMYVYDRSSPPKIASCGQLGSDPTLMHNAVADGRACPGLLLCGDNMDAYITAMAHASDFGTGVFASVWNANMDLRIGESFNRTWESWLNEHPTPRSNADSAPGNDPPYHHEASKDWKDTYNFPYWEPYSLTTAQTTTLNIPMVSYRRWANGTETLTPDFRSGAYTAMLDPASHDIATYNDDSRSPDLHAATVGVTGEAVFKINLPFYITDASFSGDFVKTNSSDVCAVLVSKDGSSWTQAWSATNTGATHADNVSLRSNVFGTWATWYIKVQLKSTNAITDVGVSNFVVTTIFEHNKGAMAYLDKGVNHITLTFDNPDELQASGNVLHVLYKWKEYDGSDWTIEKQFETYATASPTSFTITTEGSKVPRTESILLEVVPPPTDPYAPGQVTDLAAGAPFATKVPLTWTASGDDGYTGTASAYDLRYSTSPITDDVTFAAATQVEGVPSPKQAGQQESFMVTGLEGSTTYYFALKVHDKGGNVSDMSNPVTATTTPPDLVAPEFIGNLVAKPSTNAGGVDLTWTAPEDYGVNKSGPYTCASYELRYSSSPIAFDDGGASWDAATPVDGLAAPKAPGTAEGYSVTGLTGSTEYYFAIRSTDDSGNVSEISNCAAAKASVIGVMTLQDGVNGYMGCSDSYAYVGQPTTNNGSRDRMTITGFGSSAVQRGYLRFDLSSIPAGAQITSATLYLYSYDPTQSIGSGGEYGAYPATLAWSDNSVTWNNASSGVGWTIPGGDFDATPDGTSPKQVGASVWYPFAVTDGVQRWISNPDGNLGWIIKCVDENSRIQDRMYQSDTADAAFRPKLVISDMAAPGKAGDINGDGSVNVGDLQVLAGCWGKTFRDRGFEPNADLNSDGYTNVGDLQMLISALGPSSQLTV